MFGWMVMATILFIQQVLFQSYALKWQGSSLLINFGMDSENLVEVILKLPSYRLLHLHLVLCTF